MKTIKVLFLFAILLVPVLGLARPINRDILALVDGEEILIPSDNLINHFAEMPLNHMGYTLHYVDISKGLPTNQEMSRYDFVLTWFKDNKVAGAANYAKWATEQLTKGKKFIIFEDFGIDFDTDLTPTSEEIKEKFFKAFHISFNPDYSTRSPLMIEVIHNDPSMTEFERSLVGDVSTFENIKVLDKTAKVYLQLQRRDNEVPGDAVFIHSRGAFVMTNYVSFENPIDFQTRWRINPFKFFKAALDQDFPKPDVTTINGMRIFYSHIDGDGIRSLSSIDRKSSCGRTIYNEILTQYNLPISVSVIVGDVLTLKGKDQRKLIKNIRQIFKLPNVGIASHGWAHPLIWTGAKRKMGINVESYFNDYEYSPKNEIGGSIDYINEHLAPKDKKTNTFFWTGDCLPDAEALKYVFDNSIKSINGGDGRLDDKYPSYTYVAPLFRHAGGYLQYFATNSNENTYTNGWTGPFYGFHFVTQTFQRTESPFRLRPIDIYYHFFSGEHRVSLDAVNHAYNWALKQEIAPIFATDYIDIMEGFVATKIKKITPAHWQISNNGKLQTIRFDEYNGHVDMVRSKGVLGFLNYQGSLYVHLDNGDTSTVVLTNSPPSGPYLRKAGGNVKGWAKSASVIDFKLHAMSRIAFEIGAVSPNRIYEIWLNNKIFEAKSDKNGVLKLFYEEKTSPIKWLNVRLAKNSTQIKSSVFEYANRFKWVDVRIKL